MFESFDQLPHRAIQRGRHARFFSPFDNRAVHEIHFGLALGQHVLQHAGVVLAGGVGAFFDERSGIAVKFNAQGFGNGFAFGDQFVEKCASGREARGRPMMQQRECTNGICRRIENQLGPLGPTRIHERNDMHAASIEKVRESFYKFVRRVRRLERANPGIPTNVKANVAWFDEVPGGKRGAPNYVFDVVGDNFFVANTVLHGAHGTVWAEDLSCLLDRRSGVRAFRGDDAEVARGDLRRIACRVETRGEVRSAADAKTARIYGLNVTFVYVIRMDLDILKPSEMRSKDTANRATTNDADFHAHAVLRASAPE